MGRNVRSVCLALAGVNVLSAALIAGRVAGYPGFLKLQGAGWLFIGCLGALGAYAATAIAAVQWKGLPAARELRLAVYAGAGGAAWMSIQLLTERFATLPSGFNGPVVLVAMLVMFSAWGWVAFASRRGGLGVVASLALAVGSAMVTMTLGVCFGVLLELYLAPIALESMRSWPEFQRSGWSDVGAFALANTMDSVISHMVVGPMAALVFGALGIFIASAIGGRLQRLITGR